MSFYALPGTIPSANANANWSMTIKAPAGGKVLRVRALDRAGNASAWQEIRYTHA